MNPFARFPFIRFVLPLIAGITLEVYFHFDPRWCIAALAFAGFTITVFSYSRWLRSIYNLRYFFAAALQLFWLGLGLTLTSFNDETKRDNYFEEIPGKKYFIVKLKEPLSRKQRSYKALGEVTGVYTSDDVQPAKGNLLLYFSGDSDIATKCYCGDELLVPCSVSPIDGPKNPGEFNFSRFLAYQYTPANIFERRGLEIFNGW
jgi:competence protein ComEC